MFCPALPQSALRLRRQITPAKTRLTHVHSIELSPRAKFLWARSVGTVQGLFWT